MEKCYVAKCSLNLGKFHEFELSPRFDNARDCLEFIQTNKNIIIIEYLLTQSFKFINDTYYDSNGIEKTRFTYSLGSFVRVYNLDQNRFCNSFDF